MLEQALHITARTQQAPRCIAAGILWIIATSVTAPFFQSPAAGALLAVASVR